MKIVEKSELFVNKQGELRNSLTAKMDGFEIIGLFTWFSNKQFLGYKRVSDQIKRTEFLTIKDSFLL